MKDKLLIFDDEKINLKKTIYMLILVMIISAIVGFIYETIFYRIDLGHFVKRGSTFGPWIPIYAFGGLFITLISYRLRKKPFLVFILNCLITGTLEYLTGYILYEFKGIRLWDYNTEIWNFGNVNGYICLRSVLLFGIAGIILIYSIIPLLKKIAYRISEKKLATISLISGILFIMDMILYKIIK